MNTTLIALSPFSCTSVPLRDPRGEVIGVLDITREGVMSQPQDSLSTLMLAAGNIESRLFGLYHPSSWCWHSTVARSTWAVPGMGYWP